MQGGDCGSSICRGGLPTQSRTAGWSMAWVGDGLGLVRRDGVAEGVGVLEGLPCAPSWSGAVFTWLSAAGANSATAGGEDWLASSATTPRVKVAATAIAVNTTPGPRTRRGRAGAGTGAVFRTAWPVIATGSPPVMSG